MSKVKAHLGHLTIRFASDTFIPVGFNLERKICRVLKIFLYESGTKSLNRNKGNKLIDCQVIL